MTKSVTIALDAMGGDVGPAVVVPAALKILDADPNVRLTLVGRREALEQDETDADTYERATIARAPPRVNWAALLEQQLPIDPVVPVYAPGTEVNLRIVVHRQPSRDAAPSTTPTTD